MNSEEMIKVLEYLGDKFGMVVDWTNKNALPYAKDLISRIISYKITINIIGIFIWSILCVAGILYALKIRNLCKAAKNGENTGAWYYDKHCECCSDVAMITSCLSILFSILFAIITVCLIINLIQWCVVPELQLWELIKGIN